MKDVVGKELNIGDRIVMIPQNGYTSALAVGIVEGFTPHKVRIRVTNKVWQYSDDTCLKFPEQVAVVEPQ